MMKTSTACRELNKGDGDEQEEDSKKQAVPSDEKKVCLNIITHLLRLIPYQEIKRAKVVLLKRQSPGKYKEPDYPYKYVPAIY